MRSFSREGYDRHRPWPIDMIVRLPNATQVGNIFVFQESMRHMGQKQRLVIIEVSCGYSRCNPIEEVGLLTHTER